MHPRRLKQQLSVTLRNAAGQQFKGEFGDPNGFPRPRREVQNIPHRSLAVNRTSVARDGDIALYKGSQFLLCGQHTLTDVKLFLALEIKHHLRWTRRGQTVDPLSGMKKDGGEIDLDPALPCILDPVRSLEELNFQKATYRLLTGADIQEGDKVDGMTVLIVSDLLGIRVAELA